MAKSKMKLGLNFTQQKNLRDVAKWYEACDKAGLAVVGTPDSPALLRELYVSTTVAAMATSRIQIMTMVTNPVTRHPSITASAAMSLDELAPGRIAIGIATGDSALWATKQKAATVADLREYILAVKALLRGEPATYRGENLRASMGQLGTPRRADLRCLFRTQGVVDGLAGGRWRGRDDGVLRRKTSK